MFFNRQLVVRWEVTALLEAPIQKEGKNMTMFNLKLISNMAIKNF